MLTSLTDLIVLVAISWLRPTTAAGGPGDHQRIPKAADGTGSDTLTVTVDVSTLTVAADAVPEMAPIESALVTIAPVSSRRALDRLGDW